MYNDLYIYLVDKMHAALNPAPKPVDPLDELTLAKLKAMADEYECTGQLARAEVMHQERLLNERHPEVWFDYGMCLLRLGKVGRAEECLRECLSLAPHHTDALMAMTGVSMYNGVTTDPLLLETAFAATYELRQLLPESSLVCALQVGGWCETPCTRWIDFVAQRWATVLAFAAGTGCRRGSLFQWSVDHRPREPRVLFKAVDLLWSNFSNRAPQRQLSTLYLSELLPAAGRHGCAPLCLLHTPLPAAVPTFRVGARVILHRLPRCRSLPMR